MREIELEWLEIEMKDGKPMVIRKSDTTVDEGMVNSAEVFFKGKIAAVYDNNNPRGEFRIKVLSLEGEFRDYYLPLSSILVYAKKIKDD